MKKKHSKGKIVIVIVGILLASILLLSYCGSTEDDDEHASSENAITVESISTEKYAYNTLSEEEQVVYDQVLDAILNFDQEVTVSTKDYDVLQKCYDAVMDDYGELFWNFGFEYSTYTSGDEVVELTFKPTYIMSEEEKNAYQAEVDEVVAEWLSDLPEDASDYEKSKYVYKQLIERVDYQKGVENNQNILSVFLNGVSVCQGYANAANYLFSQLGIQSCVITGIADGEHHAWNLVLLDGQYYYMDITWGNSDYMDSSESVDKHVNYTYLNMTSEDMDSTHTANVPFDLPDCTATEDNYFIKEGKFFDTWDPDAVGYIYGTAQDNGEDLESVKFANSDLYTQCLDYMITDAHIYDYCLRDSSVIYSEDKETCVLTLIY